MTAITSTSTEHRTPRLPARGDLVFVYDGGLGLVTRLEGWALSVVEMLFGDGPEATRSRMVAVVRDADGALDISARVSRLAAVESAWHLVNPAGNIVNGGPRGEKPSLTPAELEAVRDSGQYESHRGAVAVYGIPSTAQHSPSAGADWVHDVPAETVFRAARGGMYRWYEPDAAPADKNAPAVREPAARAGRAAGSKSGCPYETVLAAARKAGARCTDNAGVMALFCADTLQTVVGAVSPQLVWEGAQRRGMSAADLVRLCTKDVLAVCDLQWTDDVA
ncbi:hypothetical protein [Streptomyces melanogenes]|uniref:hypothetical protein n=1 Tax=Streptomyces melanogenes TaxID=67326 RepID=UPI00167E00CA|nr:hypothetical protein [Streptomyces melanogenes]GGP80232.1 hypothetical protein GCM10010278_68360 [Streptomyces melanogenes]